MIRQWIAGMALALVSLSAGAQFDINRLIDLGKKATEAAKATRDFTQDEEIELGQGVTAGLLGAMPLHPDDRMQRYVNRVGRWVAQQSERADLPWAFAVLETETINAFAMPGGMVVVSHGLLRRLNNESELAGVLGHEIAHVLQKHQLSAIKAAAGTDLLAAVGKEAAAYRIGRSGGDAFGLKSQLAGAGIDAVKNGVFLRPLDRSLEYEADRIGVVLAARAGYDPYGLVAALQMLQSVKGDDPGFTMFTTHPQPADRIAELEKVVPTVLEKFASQPQVEGRFKQSVR
jgi:predicted Zn-dependent protease